QAILEADARALAKTLYVQVLRPFAAINFGDAELAPQVLWNVSPPEDHKTNSQTLFSCAEALNFMRLAGYKVRDPVALARRYGIKLGDIEHVEPIQVQARLAGKTGKDDDRADDAKDRDDQQARSSVRTRARRGHGQA